MEDGPKLLHQRFSCPQAHGALIRMTGRVDRWRNRASAIRVRPHGIPLVHGLLGLAQATGGTPSKESSMATP
eukprot:409187-Lingulodinium_polyedra.AAC.1